VNPNGTFEYLSLFEDHVVLGIVHYTPGQHGEVEYLVTRSADVESAGLAPLRNAEHVQDGASDVDGSPECVVKCTVLQLAGVLPRQAYEDSNRRETEGDEHCCSDRSEGWLIKLGQQAGSEGTDTTNGHETQENVPLHEGLLARESIEQNGHRAAEDEHGDAAVVEAGQNLGHLLRFHIEQMECS